MKARWLPRIAGVLLLACAFGNEAAGEEGPSRGQSLYVPVYSEIPFGEGKRALPLTATVSVRNTDRRNSIALKRLDYYDGRGTLVRAYLKEPRVLAPFSAVEYVVAESDRKGGISASFFLEWSAEAPCSPPVVEAVMISTRAAQGVSFAVPARVLEDRR